MPRNCSSLASKASGVYLDSLKYLIQSQVYLPFPSDKEFQRYLSILSSGPCRRGLALDFGKELSLTKLTEYDLYPLA